MLDQLPRCQKWMLDEITVKGDVLGEDGKVLTKRLEIWRRDPIECIRELIGNPAYQEAMAYAPERVYLDVDGNERWYPSPAAVAASREGAPHGGHQLRPAGPRISAGGRA